MLNVLLIYTSLSLNMSAAWCRADRIQWASTGYSQLLQASFHLMIVKHHLHQGQKLLVNCYFQCGLLHVLQCTSFSFSVILSNLLSNLSPVLTGSRRLTCTHMTPESGCQADSFSLSLTSISTCSIPHIYYRLSWEYRHSRFQVCFLQSSLLTVQFGEKPEYDSLLCLIHDLLSLLFGVVGAPISLIRVCSLEVIIFQY